MAAINTNVISLNAQRNIGVTQSSLALSIQRLSSGLRVNSAKDDAAGLAIAERMNAQVRGMNVAIRNANDGISFAQTAEGALGKVGDMLQRMRELAVQSANATNGTDDRVNLNAEYRELAAEVGRSMTAAKFNGIGVLTTAGTQKFQVGADAGQTIDVVTVDVSAAVDVAAVTNVANVITGADGSAATTALGVLDKALTEINKQRATWGAAQNRFESAIATLQVSVENQAAARGRIMDADFAAETASLSRAQVLQQAGMAMLSQANAVPQNVLSLLR